jgi:hypothetical protein
MKLRSFLILFVLIAGVYGESNALEFKGVNFPETVTIQNLTCKLNGVGLRKKVIINVYLGALYLAEPSNAPEKIIASDQIKQVTMHFLYKEVKPEQLNEAWDEGFSKNFPNAAVKLKPQITAFKSYFTEPMKKDDTMSFTYIPGKGTEVVIKGKSKGIIEGKEFMTALFSVWFGQFPPDKGLKEGMTGK